ncbi:MAG: hypothetical protein WC733_02475 [Methylophilus sp.]|jgi:hypothetical protein
MLRLATIASLLLYCVNACAISAIQISAEQISQDNIELKQTSVTLNLKDLPTVAVNSQFKQKAQKDWTQAQLNCDVPARLTLDTWHCQKGLLHAERLNLPFKLNIMPQANGVLVDLDLAKASFSDAVGLHAAENMTGHLQLQIKQEGKNLRWTNTLNWTGGEMFWQPFYLTGGGHQLSATGVWGEQDITFDKVTLNVKEVGALNFKGQMRLKDYQLTQFDADLPNMDLAKAYPMIFQPLLDKTMFNQADIAGQASLQVSMRNSEIKSFDLKLKDVDIDDKNKKFAFYKINAHIPWSYDEAKQVSFAYLNGHLLNLPLGATDIHAEVNRYALTAPLITLPILNGALKLSDISAARIGTNWYWHLGAQLQPISMPSFSQALKWPSMQGQASASIPQVTYNDGILRTEGEMVFNVFRGSATVTHLVLIKPLSEQPKLQADMNLRNLDLGELTRTFSFGAIEGKLDGDIANLEMQNWKMVKFDGKVQSSPGDYPKKISQRAVENISALGGAGAAAAIQRSFLRFFKQFNYDKLGLSCQLRNDICQMDGIESTAGGYLIVKGSGIPAINVMGFNHSVGWDDLLGRIKRITDNNTKAIVK